jgi:hypothetical protein
MRAFFLDKIQLLRIMLSCFSQLEFPVVSGPHTISKYKSLVHMSSYIGTFFMWNKILACFIFTWPEKPQCNLPGSCVLVSDGTYRYWTGKNVTCPVRSTLSWSAEFKHRNISANAVHVCLRRLAASQRPLSKARGKTVMQHHIDSKSLDTYIWMPASVTTRPIENVFEMLDAKEIPEVFLQ